MGQMTMQDMRAITSDQIALARRVLVKTAVALVVRRFPGVVPPVRRELIARLGRAVTTLGAVMEEQIYPVRVAADRVVMAYQRPEAWASHEEAEDALRIALLDFFLVRSDAAAAQFDAASAGDVVEG